MRANFPSLSLPSVFSPFLPDFSFPKAWLPILLSLSLSSFLPSFRVSYVFTLRFLLSIPLPVFASVFSFRFFEPTWGGLRSFVLQMPLFLALSFIAHFVCSSFYASPLPAAFLHTFAADVVSVLLISALISALGRVHAKISDLSRVLWMVY